MRGFEIKVVFGINANSLREAEETMKKWLEPLECPHRIEPNSILNN